MKLPPGSGAYALPWVAHAPGFEKYEQVRAQKCGQLTPCMAPHA